jgi:hypothetical protein
VILHLGGRRLAMPLSDVALYAPAMEQVAVRDNPVWMAGAVADRATKAPCIAIAQIITEVVLEPLGIAQVSERPADDGGRAAGAPPAAR